MDVDFIKNKLKYYQEPADGIFDFLPKELGEIKKVEIETYSWRADKFEEEKILKGDFVEMKLFEPIYKKDKSSSFFLEIAGGDGRFALRLMRDGYKIVETDIAPGSVKRAREFAKKLEVADQNYFMTLDAENLPFKDESLDGVFMVAALHHLPDFQKALSEIFRVCKKDACVLILREPASWFHYAFWPIIVFLRWIVRKKTSAEPKSLADDLTMGFSKRKLRKIFQKAGFSEIKVMPVDYLKKYYLNYCFLKARLLKKQYHESARINNFFEKIDRTTAKIPLLNLLAWDWDSVMYKR